MKSKARKGEELSKGKALMEKSSVLIYADFSRVPAEKLRALRTELRKIGAGFLVIKKRLLGVLLKEKGIEANVAGHKVSMGTVFAPDIEKAASTVHKFFKDMALEGEKILGGFDLMAKQPLEAGTVKMIGSLPPREVLLGQVVGMIAAPLTAFMYVLKERAKMVEQGK